MAGEADFLEFSLQIQEDSDFGATLTYAAKDYPCSLGAIGFGARLVDGGFSPNAETTCVVRKSILAAGVNFQTGQLVVLTDGNGVAHNLKIASMGVRDLIFAWELTLDDPDQAA